MAVVVRSAVDDGSAMDVDVTAVVGGSTVDVGVDVAVGRRHRFRGH